MIVKVIVILIFVMIMVEKYSDQAPFHKPSHANPTTLFFSRGNSRNLLPKDISALAGLEPRTMCFTL